MSDFVPAWCSDHPDNTVSLILSMAACRATGVIDAEAAYAITRDALTEAGEADVAARVDKIAELITFVEHFTHEPADAVDVWNQTYGDNLTVLDAPSMAERHKADAVALAEALRDSRRPRLQAVTS